MGLPSPSADTTSIITGASAGIGSALAQALARRGHHVTLVARRRGRLDELAEHIRSEHGTGAQVIECDLGDEASRARMVQEVAERGATVSCLCNNAGFGSAGAFVELEREAELAMVRLNCEAVIDLCSRYAPEMVDRGAGAILNVASTAAFQPLPRQASYAASKAMVLSFTEALHQELSGTGVTVTALCPGPVRTEFSEKAGIGEIEDSTPSFLWSSAEDAAEAGVKGLEAERRVVVPGPINLFTSLAGTFAPHALSLRALARLYPAGR